MGYQAALPAGIIGTAFITALHEGARQIFPNTPRVELMGERAIKKFVLDPLGTHVSEKNLYLMSIAGDLLHNSLFYAAVVGLGAQDKMSVLRRSLLYGLGVGLATWFIPPKVGLGQQPTSNKRVTASLTFALYVLGGLATTLAYLAVRDKTEGQIIDATKNADRSQSSPAWEVQETQLIYTLS